MSYRNMGELVRAFAKNPVFDETACKFFLYYLSQIAHTGHSWVKWDIATPLAVLGISRAQYDSTIQALSEHGFLRIQQESEDMQILTPLVVG